MRVKALPRAEVSGYFGYLENIYDELVEGMIYSVLAIERWSEGQLMIYVHSVDEHEWPSPFPFGLFKLVDANLPFGWKLGLDVNGTLGLSIKRISFPEWVDDDLFYERLVDGEEIAISAYRRWRSILNTNDGISVTTPNS